MERERKLILRLINLRLNLRVIWEGRKNFTVFACIKVTQSERHDDEKSNSFSGCVVAVRLQNE